MISQEEARMFQSEGMTAVWVTELEKGEVGEDDAVMQVASESCCGALEIRLGAGGRANMFATEDCCVDAPWLGREPIELATHCGRNLTSLFCLSAQYIQTVQYALPVERNFVCRRRAARV